MIDSCDRRDFAREAEDGHAGQYGQALAQEQRVETWRDALLGLRHGRRLAKLDRRFSSLVDAQLAGPPTAWHPELRRAVARVAARDFELDPDDLDGSLDLVAVAVRRPASQAPVEPAPPAGEFQPAPPAGDFHPAPPDGTA